MPPKGKSHIERLKERLYSPKSKDARAESRSPIYDDPREVNTSWPQEKMPERKKRKNILKNSMFRKFFLIAAGFFILCAGFGLFVFFGGGNTVSAGNIEINVLGNAFTSGGEELPLQFQIINRNNVALEYSDLILSYQKGSGTGEEIQRDRITVGTVPSGGKVEKLVNLTLFGQQGATRDINITLEYRVRGSSAIFVKEDLYVVNISSTPVNLLVDGPDTTNTNQDISFTITTSVNSEKAIENMMVVVKYPPGFSFKSAAPQPTFSNNIWSLGDLASGAQKKIVVNGTITAQSGEQRAFNILVGSANPKNEQSLGTQFNSHSYVVAVEKPFLDLNFLVNGNSDAEVSINSSGTAKGEIKVTNNLSTKITDTEITAHLYGNAFDSSSVEAVGGFYDSQKQTIVWNSHTKPSLGSLNPGDEQTVSFNFKPLVYSTGNIKSPEIDIDVGLSGREPSLGNSFKSIDGIAKKKIKFATDAQITGYALYHSGPFTNSGPLPPTPGQGTTYTVFLSVANTTNRISNAKAITSLPVYVDWLGAVSPAGSSVSYNTSSREVSWDIGAIDPGVGLSTVAKSVYFQVRLNPSTTQIGTPPKLMTDVVLTAKDSFTGLEFSRTLQPITTRLNRDSNYNFQNDNVK